MFTPFNRAWLVLPSKDGKEKDQKIDGRKMQGAKATCGETQFRPCYASHTLY
jgi:hypothetical protein